MLRGTLPIQNRSLMFKEKKMKSFAKLLVFIMLISLLAGCTTPATPTKSEPTAVPLSAAEQYAKDNQLGPYQTATQDWAAIEAAAIKEGKVVVYANSSKIEKLIELWNAKYPNIILEGSDTDDIATKMREEQLAENVVGDVWFNSDGDLLYGEFVPNQWLWAFVPDSVVIPEVTAARPFAISRHSVDVLGYNNELNPDGCPLTNLWQITEPALKGKVFLEDPIANVSTTAQISIYTQHGDEMAAAYSDLYGKEWTTDPAYTSDLENAGWLFIKKWAANSPGIQPGGDEVMEAFATPGMTENFYGWTGYSNYADTLAGDVVFAPCFTLRPIYGFYKTNYFGIANNASHPNAAKLFIKFALSEEGFAPWNTLGSYSAVEGRVPPEGAIPVADLKVWTYDDFYNYEHVSAVRDFWAINLLNP
jgi:iron(III) transport system substrate-binding protein